MKHIPTDPSNVFFECFFFVLLHTEVIAQSLYPLFSLTEYILPIILKKSFDIFLFLLITELYFFLYHEHLKYPPKDHIRFAI